MLENLSPKNQRVQLDPDYVLGNYSHHWVHFQWLQSSSNVGPAITLVLFNIYMLDTMAMIGFKK